MKPGPAPLPGNVHAMRGNPSKKSANALRDELKPVIVLPDPPDSLSESAKAEWVRLGPEMIRLGLITNIDRAAFSVCCEHWATWLMAQDELKKLGPAGYIESTPSGYKQMSVWLQIRNRAAEGLRQYLNEFGMTPSARTGFTSLLSPQLPLFPDADSNASGAQAPINPAARHFGASSAA
jgi:P27 family predicted phage terminase small subunit